MDKFNLQNQIDIINSLDGDIDSHLIPAIKNKDIKKLEILAKNKDIKLSNRIIFEIFANFDKSVINFFEINSNFKKILNEKSVLFIKKLIYENELAFDYLLNLDTFTRADASILINCPNHEIKFSNLPKAYEKTYKETILNLINKSNPSVSKSLTLHFVCDNLTPSNLEIGLIGEEVVLPIPKPIFLLFEKLIEEDVDIKHIKKCADRYPLLFAIYSSDLIRDNFPLFSKDFNPDSPITKFILAKCDELSIPSVLEKIAKDIINPCSLHTQELKVFTSNITELSKYPNFYDKIQKIESLSRKEYDTYQEKNKNLIPLFFTFRRADSLNLLFGEVNPSANKEFAPLKSLIHGIVMVCGDGARQLLETPEGINIIHECLKDDLTLYGMMHSRDKDNFLVKIIEKSSSIHEIKDKHKNNLAHLLSSNMHMPTQGIVKPLELIIKSSPQLLLEKNIHGFTPMDILINLTSPEKLIINEIIAKAKEAIIKHSIKAISDSKSDNKPQIKF